MNDTGKSTDESVTEDIVNEDEDVDEILSEMISTTGKLVDSIEDMGRVAKLKRILRFSRIF